MQKVDITIAVFGAVALLVTGLGIALYDDVNGINDYVVTKSDVDTFGNEGVVPAGGLTWDFAVPDNTFHAVGELTLDWSGSLNPTLDGPVDVVVTVTAPTGHVTKLEESFDYGDGTGAISLEIDAWAEMPDDFSAKEEAVADRSLSWDEDFTVEITITGPSGQLPLATQDDPTYNAVLAGNWHNYVINPETPNPETI